MLAVAKIVVTFRPTGRKWPVGEVQKIEVFATDAGFTERASRMRSR